MAGSPLSATVVSRIIISSSVVKDSRPGIAGSRQVRTGHEQNYVDVTTMPTRRGT